MRADPAQETFRVPANRRGVRAPAADRSPPWFWLLIAAAALLLLGSWLPLTDGVTAFYGKVARNMLATGDWLTPRSELMPVVDKPPLTFWLMSLSFAAFGATEWALRIWHLALAVAVALATYALARLTLPRRDALAAAAVLLTTMEFFYQSLVPEQHVPFVLFLTLSIYWHLRWEREQRLQACLLAWGAAGLAVLSIGIAGAVMAALVVGAHVIIDRPRLPRGGLAAAALGGAVFFALSAPWFVFEAVRLGRPFVHTFFLGGTLGVGRFFQQVQASPTVVPWWAGLGAYVLLLPLGFLPWTGWVWPAVSDGWAARRVPGSVLWICMLWTIAVLGFLSVSLGDKSSRYLLPVFPPLAVLIGQAAGNVRWARPAAIVSLATAIPLLGLVTAVAVVRFPTETARYAPLIYAFLPPFVAALGAYALAALRGRPGTGVVLLAGLALVAYALAMATVVRVWDGISPWRPLARIVNGLDAPRAHVIVLGRDNAFADFYIARPVEYASGDGLARDWTREAVIAVLPEEALSSLPASPRPAVAGAAAAGWVVVTNAPPR